MSRRVTRQSRPLGAPQNPVRPDGTLSKDVPDGEFVVGLNARTSFSDLIGDRQYDEDEVAGLKEDFLRAFYKIGYKVKACFECGISVSTINGWLDADLDFRAKFTVIDEYHTEEFRVALKKRAVEGVERNVYWQGQIIDTKIEYSDVLLIVELKRRDPQYRERATVEASIINKLYQNIDDSEI